MFFSIDAAPGRGNIAPERHLWYVFVDAGGVPTTDASWFPTQQPRPLKWYYDTSVPIPQTQSK